MVVFHVILLISALAGSGFRVWVTFLNGAMLMGRAVSGGAAFLGLGGGLLKTVLVETH